MKLVKKLFFFGLLCLSISVAAQGYTLLPEGQSITVASPAAFTVSQNNYVVSVGTDYLRVSATTPVSISGIVAPSPVFSRKIIVRNVGSSTITLLAESTSSTTTNRFSLNANTDILAKQAVTLLYDTVESRWFIQK